MFYEQLFLALSRHHVRYAVVGGLAVNLHGIPRMTADVDLLVDLSAVNLQKFLDCMKELGFRPRLPLSSDSLLCEDQRRDWITNRNFHAFTFWNENRPFEEIDVLLTESKGVDIVNRAQPIQAGDLTIYVATIDDIIAMKRRVSRLQDISDISALEQLKKKDGQ